MKGDSGPPGIKGKVFVLIRMHFFSNFKLLSGTGERGDSIVGPKGDRGAPGLPGR
jgi:hypothetical protein